MLLGTPAAVFVILVSHLVEWLWHKYPWYIQLFNIGNYALAMTSAHLVLDLLSTPDASPQQRVLSILAAMGMFTFINHLLVGFVIKLARGQSFSQSGVFGPITLMIDLSMIGMGGSIAILWGVNPYATILSILPLYLIYSTLKVPALQRQTEIDSKTKLFNARYFADVLEKELERAERFARPLTLVMADLDLLRNINNTYGHLAGDVVLIGVAEALQTHCRDYDIVARFGGEEFAILMPETTAEEAYALIDSIRGTIEVTDFEVSTSITPIKATVSFGIAGRTADATTITDLIHNADLALYHSKLSGRNLTSVYADDCMDELFGKLDLEIQKPDKATLEARISFSERPFKPDNVRSPRPVVEKSSPLPVSPAAEPPPSSQFEDKTKPPRGARTVRSASNWKINIFISALVLSAIGLIALLLPAQHRIDWPALAVFALITLFTEAFSIEIYVKETSVSTAAVPIIAGALLFGPTGAVILSLVLAATAGIKNRSQIKKFIFNASNHMISNSLGVGLVALSGGSILELPIWGQFGLSLAAAVINYITNTALIAGGISLSTGQPIRKIWNGSFRWLFPFFVAFGLVAYALILGYSYTGIFGVLVILVPLLTLRFSQVQFIDHTKEIVSQLRKKNTQLEERSTEISTLNEDLLLALSNIVDLRDPFVYGHSQQVTHYAVEIAKELKLPERRIELIRKASLLHDVGKMGVSENILFKPGPLSADEYDEVKKHTILGAEIIKAVHSLQGLAPIIRHHHERLDGHGYPDGLQGQDIPLEARIICLADSLEAMASDRPYRKALSYEEILHEIDSNTGTQFDPLVVNAFRKIIAREGQISLVNSALLLETRGNAEIHTNSRLS